MPESNGRAGETQNQKGEVLEKIIKASVLPLIIASIPFFSSSISILAEAFFIGPREHRTQILVKILEKENDLEVLNRVGFLIDAGLLDGEIFWNPKKELLAQDTLIYLSSKLVVAAQNEGAGLQAIIENKYDSAKGYFQEAYRTYPTYGSVDETKFLLNLSDIKGEPIENNTKGCIIAHYSLYNWNISDLQLQELRKKYPDSCKNSSISGLVETIDQERKQ